MSRNIDIRGLGNEETLARVARLAYGSGRTEKTSGGNGNIGLLDGRVVKFNTHWGERGGAVSDAMRASCDALRTRLSDIATSLLAAREDADAAINAKLARALAKVRAALGMAPDGAAVATTGLLERKAVAKVLNTIQEATGFDVWEDLRRGDPAALSSRGVDTTFERVRLDACLVPSVRAAAAALAHPADGLAGVTLGAAATDFLVGLVRRDVEARRAAGAAVPTLDEIVGGIRDFSSPALNVTLQAFNLHANCIQRDRPAVGHRIHSAAYLAGAPDAEREDRADVAVSFLSGFDAKNELSMTNIMAFVSEKMPEMRRLQPQGRLTGATVWRACFDEEPPAAVVRQWGSLAYVDAFLSRLDGIVTPFCRLHGKDRDMKALNVRTIDPYTCLVAENGMSFTAMLNKVLEVPGFVPDPRRDYVAAPPLYPVPDAAAKTDRDFVSQLELDVVRQHPVIAFHDGDRQDGADFRRFVGDPAGARAAVPGFLAQVDAFYRTGEGPGDGVPAGITRIQRQVLILGFTQAAFAPLMALVGVGGEHVQAQIDVRRDGDAIVMTYSTMPDFPVEARYSYRIEADGSNRRVGEFVGRLRAQQVG